MFLIEICFFSGNPRDGVRHHQHQQAADERSGHCATVACLIYTYQVFRTPSDSVQPVIDGGRAPHSKRLEYVRRQEGDHRIQASGKPDVGGEARFQVIGGGDPGSTRCREEAAVPWGEGRALRIPHVTRKQSHSHSLSPRLQLIGSAGSPPPLMGPLAGCNVPCRPGHRHSVYCVAPPFKPSDIRTFQPIDCQIVRPDCCVRGLARLGATGALAMSIVG